MTKDEKLENIAMAIIANGGAARAAAFDALKAAKKGDFDKSDELLASSESYAHEAHLSHSKLLTMFANGEVEYSNPLTSHAQDHLMTADLAKELITEIVELRKEIERR
jgi:PTS system cellobiose-specific IIA component